MAIRRLGMTSELQIPESALGIKADYFERPSRQVVGLIKEFIERFGTPHLWYGHTHTKPGPGSRVTFLAKYTLPKSHHRRDRWAPCPCCSPRHPKYFRHGLIAWFPDEGVIRCVGDKCYRTLDPLGYELAMKQLTAEIESERTVTFLLDRMPNIPAYLQIVEASLPVFAAIDDLRNQMLTYLDLNLAIDLWPHINDGMLRKVVLQNVIVRRRDGSEDTELSPMFVDYGFVPGYPALKPGRSKLESRLNTVLKTLEALNFGAAAEARIAAMTETEKDKTAKLLSWAHKKANQLIIEALSVRRFFTKDAVETVNGWSRQENAPLQIHFAMDSEGFMVGRSDASHLAVPWPEHFWTALTELSPLSKAIAA